MDLATLLQLSSRQRRKILCAFCGKQFRAPNDSYCPECIIKRHQYWNNRREITRKNDRERSWARKVRVLTRYGPNQRAKCWLCPESRLAALTIDHINGGGRAHAKKIGPKLHQWLEHNNFPEGFRTLCSNCNWKEYLVLKNATLTTTRVNVIVRGCIRRLKQRFMSALGNRCVICGCSDFDTLTASHLNNDGAAHRKQISNGETGTKFYRAILKSGDFTNLECRCFNCNDSEQWGGSCAG
jgi:hypothetical protein